MADEIKTEAPDVTAQESKLVGDEAVQAEVHTVEPTVVSDQVAAQVVQPREGDADKVNVHETFVQMDTVITDPSSPLAVQIPDAGRGDLSLPIHRLSAPTVEDVFSKEASEAEEKTETEAAKERQDEPVNDRT